MLLRPHRIAVALNVFPVEVVDISYIRLKSRRDGIYEAAKTNR